MSVTELLSLPNDELDGWFDYFEQRPYEWRDDNRAAVAAQVAGSKARPEELFDSLKTMRRRPEATVAQKFLERFQHRFTEELPDDSIQDQGGY